MQFCYWKVRTRCFPATGAQWCLCIFLLLMENRDWTPDFPLAPSPYELQHDWGSGGPLSNVAISHVAKANATSEKYWRKQNAKIPFAPPWVNWSPEDCPVKALLLYQSLATLWVMYNTGHRSAWVVTWLGWTGHCPAQGQQGPPLPSGPQHLWSCGTHKLSLTTWPKEFFCC